LTFDLFKSIFVRNLELKTKEVNISKIMKEQEKLTEGTNNEGATENEEMSFLQHLEELRWHIVRSAAAIIIFAIVAFINYEIIFDQLILKPKTAEFATNKFFAWIAEMLNIGALSINTKPLEIINIKLSGQFSTHIKISVISGIILAFPYIFWEFWRFIKPALYTKEQKYTSGAVFFSSFLFITGVLFGYYVIVPLSIHFLGSYNISGEVNNQISLGSYISTVSSIVLAGGVVFELPIIVYFLSKVGIITPEFLRKYRKHAYVVLLLLSAVITPPDVFSQVLVCFPLVFLYEIGITISRRIAKKKKEEELEA
jgi:sec-independent protein translocase protein TatC